MGMQWRCVPNARGFFPVLFLFLPGVFSAPRRARLFVFIVSGFDYATKICPALSLCQLFCLNPRFRRMNGVARYDETVFDTHENFDGGGEIGSGKWMKTHATTDTNAYGNKADMPA